MHAKFLEHSELLVQVLGPGDRVLGTDGTGVVGVVKGCGGVDSGGGLWVKGPSSGGCGVSGGYVWAGGWVLGLSM